MTQINCSKRRPKAANKIKKKKRKGEKKSTPQQAPYSSRHPSLRIPAPAARKALPVSGIRVRAAGQAVPWAHTAALVPRSPGAVRAARRPRRTRAACSEAPALPAGCRRRPGDGRRDRMLPWDPHNLWELQLCPLGGKLRHWEPSASRFRAVSMSPRSSLAQRITSRWPLHHPQLSPSYREQAFSSESADISFPKALISRPSGSLWLAPGALVAVTQLLVTFCTDSVTPMQLQNFPTCHCHPTGAPPDLPVPKRCWGVGNPLQGCLDPRDAPTRTGSSQPLAQLATARLWGHNPVTA